MYPLQIDGIPHIYGGDQDTRIWSYNASADDWTVIGGQVLSKIMFSYFISIRLNLSEWNIQGLVAQLRLPPR